MSKKELLERIAQWGKNGEYGKIIDAVLDLPESSVDDEIMQQLAMAYNCVCEYKKAIAVLEGLRERQENHWLWQYCMGYALVNATDDEECENDDALRENILQRARTCFSRCMVLNPPENCLEECDKFLQMIEDELFGEEDFSDNENGGDFYDDDDADALEEHIKKYFGDFPSVYRELSAPDVYIDVCVIPPSKEKNYYTLVTFGMGSQQMDIPENYSGTPSRIELFLKLPAEWKVGETDEEWCWPLILLKDIGRLPSTCDTWVGRGHTIDNHETYAVNTRLSASIILDPEGIPDNGRVCVLPSGESVEFFEVVPLFREEMLFKIDNSTDELVARFKNAGMGRIIDISRPSTVPEDYEPQSEFFWDSIFDRVSPHYKSIIEKKLPLNPLAAANHIAIFLRWCIESGICSNELTERFPDLVEEVCSGKLTDLRGFIINRFDGALFRTIIADKYRDFAEWYYRFGERGFPSDVDKCAEEYFGTERYNSEEFKDEAYLFMPFDEEYYKRLAAKITQAFCYCMYYAMPYFEMNDNIQLRINNAFGGICEMETSTLTSDVESIYKSLRALCARKKNVPFYIVDAFVPSFPKYIFNGDFFIGVFKANSIQLAVATMHTDFERDSYDIPQEIIENMEIFESKCGAKPIIMQYDPFDRERYLIPDENGYYSVSRRTCSLTHGSIKELLLSKRVIVERLYRPKYNLQGLLDCSCIELGKLPKKAVIEIYERALQCAADAGTKPVLAVISNKTAGTPAHMLEAALSNPQEFALVDFPNNWEERDFVFEELPFVKNDKAAERFEAEYGVKPLVIIQEADSFEANVAIPKNGGYSIVRRVADYLFGTISGLSKQLSDLLGCEVSKIGIIRDEQTFHKTYERVLINGKREGYIPLLIKASPSFALKAFFSSVPYLKHLTTLEEDCKRFNKRTKITLIEKDTCGDIAQSVPLTKFITCKSEQGGWSPILCAKLPTDGSALARLATLGVFGSHLPEKTLAAEKEWQKFGAVPAVLGSNTLEFFVSNPAKKGEEKLLAAQMLTLCKGLDAVSDFKDLAGSLPNSKVWFFCW